MIAATRGPVSLLPKWTRPADVDARLHGAFEIEARRELVSLVQAMIAGELLFLEGAIAVLRLEHAVGGINWSDADFMAFTAVASETDHLPRAEQRSFWAPHALSRLEPEIKQKEEWARSFAMDACKNLLDRFKNS